MAQEAAEALGLSVAADPRAQGEGLGPRGMAEKARELPARAPY